MFNRGVNNYADLVTWAIICFRMKLSFQMACKEFLVDLILIGKRNIERYRLQD